MTNHHEKIGRPSMEEPETGANIELGQPVLEEEFKKESVEATLPVIKDALEEFYRFRGNHDARAVLFLGTVKDPMKPHTTSVEELKKENGDVTVPLAILEAIRGELQQEREVLESRELDPEQGELNERIETTRQVDIEKEMHYQEAADVLFSQAEYEVPTHEDLLEWLGETKAYIRKLAKEEEEKYRDVEEGGGIGRIFRSRLLTDVPAIERYETGQHSTRDYREIMDVVNSRLFSHRDRIGTVLMQYANDPQKGFVGEMKQLLLEARKLELFLAQLEGERNERIAKKI